MKTGLYSVTVSGNGAYAIVDITTGKRLNRFNLPGVLTSGPVVSGGCCMIETITGNVRTAFTVKLPSGHVINRYVVGTV